jgi:hypothetical protein
VTAGEVCAHFFVERTARQLLSDGMGVREFVETLLVHKQYAAGIGFLAHALPAREAIWWGSLCLQHACGSELSAPEKSAFRAAVKWVLKPSEENRVAAKVPAELAKPGSPAGALVMAANQTGGSLTPPELPPLPPGPYAPAKAVASAVLFSSLKGEPVKTFDRQRLFVELGIAVAEGRFSYENFSQK